MKELARELRSKTSCEFMARSPRHELFRGSAGRESCWQGAEVAIAASPSEWEEVSGPAGVCPSRALLSISITSQQDRLPGMPVTHSTLLEDGVSIRGGLVMGPGMGVRSGGWGCAGTAPFTLPTDTFTAWEPAKG